MDIMFRKILIPRLHNISSILTNITLIQRRRWVVVLVWLLVDVEVEMQGYIACVHAGTEVYTPRKLTFLKDT